MRFVIVTGLSGSGKSSALKMLEDDGYFCVDNLPLELIGKFAELAANPAQEYSKVAVGFDARSLFRGHSTEEFFRTMQHYSYEILFLDCGDEELVRRYKETRRIHPLAGNDRIEAGIGRERALLEPLKMRADTVIDTSRMLTRHLQKEIGRLFLEGNEGDRLLISILSFGFKHGIPSDADLVFDVRFLPNPFYVEALKHKTGNDPDVQAYVCQGGEAEEFLGRLTDLLDYLLPKYALEGKKQLTVAIGCTGGKHRSVTIANKLNEYYEKKGRDPVVLLHRDLTR